MRCLPPTRTAAESQGIFREVSARFEGDICAPRYGGGRSSGPESHEDLLRRVSESFWSLVDIRGVGECWSWRGSRCKEGYGVLRVKRHRTLRAHRVAWELSSGGRLGGRFACHHCDNPSCCNPAHIYAGDTYTNMRDVARRGRQRGSRNGNAKLDEGKVAEIRRRIAAGHNNTHIAKDYGVTHQMISKIRRGHFWKDAT